MAQIKPTEYYSYTTIIKNNWIPWIKHATTFKRILETKEGAELYKPVTTEIKKKIFRKILGENLLAVLKAGKTGKLA